jgi:release factor glutamine methyltransferase
MSGPVVERLRSAGCVFAEDEAELLVQAAGSPAELSALLERRVGGEPLEYILGWAEFCQLRVALDPGVFVPRRRTELLAREAILRARPGGIAVDLCCGSGALAAALLDRVERLEVYASDIDPRAVACAGRNLGPERVFEGDLFAALPVRLRGRIDVLVVNAPYVPTDSIRLMPPEARLHEAPVSLDGGPDGLDVLRRVLAVAPAWLAPSGTVLVETSTRQAPRLVDVASRCGLESRVVTDEDLDATILSATPLQPAAVPD